MKGCKISCMATLKSAGFFPGTKAEGHLLQWNSPRSAEGHTQAASCLSRRPAHFPAMDSYTVVSWNSSVCNFPNSPKKRPSLKIYQTREKAPSWLLVQQADASKHPAPCPAVEGGQCFDEIHFSSQHTREEILEKKLTILEKKEHLSCQASLCSSGAFS